MAYPTIEELINKVWPKSRTRNVYTVLDEHEEHYGLNLSHEDIERIMQ